MYDETDALLFAFGLMRTGSLRLRTSCHHEKALLMLESLVFFENAAPIKRCHIVCITLMRRCTPLHRRRSKCSSTQTPKAWTLQFRRRAFIILNDFCAAKGSWAATQIKNGRNAYAFRPFLILIYDAVLWQINTCRPCRPCLRRRPLRERAEWECRRPDFQW